MAEAMAAPTGPAAVGAAGSGLLWRKVLRVAWLSVGLGLALEILLLTLAAYSGTGGGSPKSFAADLAQKVSWSFLVCIGLALGTTASKARPAVMGLLGLVSAPAAFAIARAVHKGVVQALALPPAPTAFPFLVAGLKALEYGVLGAILGLLTRRRASGIGAYLGTGAAIGVTFGTALILVLTRGAATPTAVDLAAKAINELLFPIGCSLVLYGAEAVTRRLQASRTG